MNTENTAPRSPDPHTRALSQAGVSLWLDDLSRTRLQNGDLANLVTTRQISGVTTNPTIFQKALTDAEAYLPQLQELAARGTDAATAVHELTCRDVAQAADVLAPVHERTGGRDGFVSIEVDPRLAQDPSATVTQAQRLAAAIDRENLMVKIPATQACLPAITEVLAAGISVNVTLIFSLPRVREVVNAWLAGLERARTAGRDLRRIHAVASLFVSRVDTEVDTRLRRLGADESLFRGAGLANARLAHRIIVESAQTERWRLLAAAGAPALRPLWASTSVKDPALPADAYVSGLAAPNTVITLPEATLHAVAEHGVRLPAADADARAVGYAAADAHLDAVGRAGVDYSDVVDTLEGAGIAAFVAAREAMLDTAEQGLARARGEASGPSDSPAAS